MPELPEVETVRKGLEQRLRGFLIEDLELLSERTIASKGGSKWFKEAMKGVLLGGWERRGKYLICTLLEVKGKALCGWWIVHLRMTGQFKWFESSHSPCPHTRVRIWNKLGNEIHFVDTRNFGQMWWISSEELPETKINGLARLGPEPFSKEFNSSYLFKCLKNKKRSIKSSLLDQSLVAGIGNIYADESLFDAGIIPTKESGKLTKKEVQKIYISVVKILKISIGEGGTTFKDFRNLEGLNGNYGGQAWVYGRNKKPCRNCGEIILKQKISGRGSHWCPSCQK